MAESAPLVISPETVRAEWEAVRDLERQAADRRGKYELQAAFLRASGLANWLPAEEETERKPGRMGKTPAVEGTWTSEIIKILRDAPDGLSNSELKERLGSGVMAKKMKSNPNGFYNGVSRLVSIGEAKKIAGRIVSIEHSDSLERRFEAGEIEDVSDGRAGTVIQQLTEFVNSRRHGATAGEIVAAMEKKGMSSGSVYNNLSKAVSKNKIRRDGKMYFPLNENGVPSGTPETGE